eukprot:6202622-Pleurochrysis_carterae.AAC.1
MNGSASPKNSSAAPMSSGAAPVHGSSAPTNGSAGLLRAVSQYSAAHPMSTLVDEMARLLRAARTRMLPPTLSFSSVDLESGALAGFGSTWRGGEAAGQERARARACNNVNGGRFSRRSNDGAHGDGDIGGGGGAGGGGCGGAARGGSGARDGGGARGGAGDGRSANDGKLRGADDGDDHGGTAEAGGGSVGAKRRRGAASQDVSTRRAQASHARRVSSRSITDSPKHVECCIEIEASAMY